MRSMGRSALSFSLVLLVSLIIGCGDSGTGPEKNPPPSSGLEHIWSKSFGDGSYQSGEAVALDASGNVVITGFFGGVVDFGGGAIDNPNNYDVFVAQFGANGSHDWSKGFGNANGQVGRDVAVDIDGNVVITGYFDGTVDFGGGPLVSAGSNDIFVAKFGADGSYLWSKRFGDSESQDAADVAVDASGNIVITGSFGGTVDFGGGALTSSDPWDIFVAQFGPDGSHQWSRRFGDSDEQHGLAVAVDATSNVIIAGNYGGTVDFGGGPVMGSFDIFVAKFSSSGTHLWSRSFGDASQQHAIGVTVDASSNVILTGVFDGIVDFGGGAVESAGHGDIFVAKLGSDGSYLWSSCFGDADEQVARAVAVDASGNIAVTGHFAGTLDFGGSALTSAGGYDIFVAKFRSDGDHLRSGRFGDGGEQESHDIAVDASGNIILTGLFYSTVDFGGSTLTSQGNYDIFVVKFAP